MMITILMMMLTKMTLLARVRNLLLLALRQSLKIKISNLTERDSDDSEESEKYMSAEEHPVRDDLFAENNIDENKENYLVDDRMVMVTGAENQEDRFALGWFTRKIYPINIFST